jgi:hypothetical protein
VQWHHIIIAFLIGILFAYAFLTLSLRIGHPSSHLGPGSEQESPWGPQTQAARDSWDCSRRLAAIYPMAMGNLTAGSGQIAPDKLIVAARHTDVTPPPPPMCHILSASPSYYHPLLSHRQKPPHRSYVDHPQLPPLPSGPIPTWSHPSSAVSPLPYLPPPFPLPLLFVLFPP